MSNVRRVLHATHNMDIGGTEQVIKQLICGLDEKCYQSSVVCLDGYIGSMGRDLQRSGVEVFSLKRKPGLDWSILFSLRKLMRREQINILHCHQYTPYFYGVLACLFTSTKVVFTEHGRFYPDRYSWKRRVVNPILNCATDSITAISCATKKALTKYEWFSERSIKVIYNGLEHRPIKSPDSGIRDTLGYADTDIILGTIARIDPIKNQIMMVEALESLKQSHLSVKMLIVGDGPERKNLESYVRSHGLAEIVDFVGFQDDTDPFLDLIDIFLLSSHSEGTSMTLLEAMSAGKPCVVTNVGGNVEIIEHGKDGLIVRAGDTIQFIESIMSLIQDPELRSLISKDAKLKFCSKFKLNHMVDAYQKLYSSLDYRRGECGGSC